VLLKLLKCHQCIYFKFDTFNTHFFNQTFSYEILVYFVGYLQTFLFHLYYQRSIVFAVDSVLQHFSLPLVRSMDSGYEKIRLRDTEYVLWSDNETLTGSCGLAVEEL